MAKKSQTPEEKLAAALVPEEEWPYELPEKWCWVRLGNINEFQSKSVDPQKEPDETFELYSVPSIENSYPEILKGEEIGSTKVQVTKDDVLLCKINPRINRVWKVSQFTEYPLLASSEWIVVRNSTIVPDFMVWCLHSEYFRKFMLENVSGVGGSLMRAKPKFVATYPIAVPPVAEQNRIVNRIGTLFAKLDAAKFKVESALAATATRKAAILHAAFTGELTVKWRQEHSVTLDSWETKKLQDLCEKITCGKTPKEYITETGEIPYLKVYNIVDDQIAFSEKPQFIPQEIHESRLKSSQLIPNDVVMNIVGPPLRKIAIIPNTYPEWNMNQAIVRFRPKDRLYYRFLYYQLINPETLDPVIQKTKGVVGQANISISQSRNLQIHLPGMDEQREIVRILDTVLAREQRVTAAAEKILADIDLMKKSVLARAFRGELGTGDPSDVSAVTELREYFSRETAK